MSDESNENDFHFIDILLSDTVGKPEPLGMNDLVLVNVANQLVEHKGIKWTPEMLSVFMDRIQKDLDDLEV